MTALPMVLGRRRPQPGRDWRVQRLERAEQGGRAQVNSWVLQVRMGWVST